MARRLTSRPLLLCLLFALWLSGCTIPERRTAAGSHHHDFTAYWPIPAKDNELCLAVKDNIDVKGVVTTAGSEYVARTSLPATHDAACLAIARARHIRIVGKANLSELTLSPSGINDYYGTPRNPFSKLHQIIPGGSSSGSAASVESGLADITFGTDTAGSIRVPAACCGIVGLKTTFGLVPLHGVFPVEPKHLDTVGPMAKDVAHVVQGMDLLEQGFAARYAAAVRSKPLGRQIKIGRLYLSGTDPKIDKAVDDALTRAGFQVVPLDQAFKAKWDAAKKDGNTVAAGGAWISDQKYAFKWGVRARTKATILLGRILYPGQYRKALERRPAWQHALNQEFKKVDLIALPTLQTVPPAIPWFGRIALLEARVLNIQNTVPVNLAGNPALAVPIPVSHEHFPMTSLQLIGPRLSEAELLNAGRIVEASR
jgi:amidase